MPSQDVFAGTLQAVLMTASYHARPPALHTLQALLAILVQGEAVKGLWCDNFPVPIPLELNQDAEASLGATLNAFMRGWERDTLSGSQSSMPLIKILQCVDTGLQWS